MVKVAHKESRFLNPQKYIWAFLIAVGIFALGFWASGYLNDRRFAQIDRARQELQIQIMGMETQLAHFKHILCDDIGADILTHELHVIGDKLQFMTNRLGQDHAEVLYLKKYYTLLQIRHYQFSKDLSQRCNLGLTHVLYFYADPRACPECQKQGHILTYLRQNHAHLRIYSFDYNLELIALSIVKPDIPAQFLEQNERPRAQQKAYLPILVINGEPFWGFHSLDEMKKLLKLQPNE